jgi:hypothetical protein
MLLSERLLKGVTQSFTANGGAKGLVTVSNTSCFKVKAEISIISDTQPALLLEVKRVISDTLLYVGPKGTIDLWTNLTAYTVVGNARIIMGDQPRPSISSQDRDRIIFDEEPTMAHRNILVDEYGKYYNLANPLSTSISDGTDKLLVNADGSINVVASSTSGQVPWVYKELNDIADTTETTVGTYTAVVDNERIARLMGNAKTFGTWKVYKTAILDANLIGMFETSPEIRNADLSFTTPEILAVGDVILVTFAAERYRLPTTSQTFIRLEGYTI